MSRVRSSLSAVLAVFALAALPSAALAFSPSPGGYHGRVDGSINNGCGGNEGEGYLRLKGGYVKPIKNGKDDCGNAVVVDEILAPSSPGGPGQCNQLNANISANRIKVSAKGSFS